MISREQAAGKLRPDDATQARPQEPDRTRVLGTAPRPPATGPSAPGPGAAPRSFGGTYAAPPRSGARFAAPAGPPTGQPPSGGGYAPPQRPESRPAYRPPPGKRRRHHWVRIVLLVLLVWLIFLATVPIWALSKISKVDAEPTGARPAETPGTTYLLVGSDSRAGLSQAQRQAFDTGLASGQRTDTILMIQVPSGGGPTLMLSIPRDSAVAIPGHSEGKINAAYAYGGPKLLVQTVEQATRVRIDDYIEIGFTGFVDIVDAVGGITVCPKTAIVDKLAGLNMKAGCQQVDGKTALGYSRSRHFPLGDITRELHQREVITAVGKKAANWQTVVLPWRYWQVNMAAANSLQIGRNVSPIELGRFAWAMAHSSGPGTKRCVVPYSNLGVSTSFGSAVQWDQAAAKAIFTDIRKDDTAAIHCSAQ